MEDKLYYTLDGNDCEANSFSLRNMKSSTYEEIKEKNHFENNTGVSSNVSLTAPEHVQDSVVTATAEDNIEISTSCGRNDQKEYVSDKKHHIIISFIKIASFFVGVGVGAAITLILQAMTSGVDTFPRNPCENDVASHNLQDEHNATLDKGCFGPLCTKSFHDCKTWKISDGASSGIFFVSLSYKSSFDVYCDMETDGGGWTVFQRRIDGSEDFNMRWQNYKQGFGNLSGEFWLGNDRISALTEHGTYELRVDMADWQGNKQYAVYDDFWIASERDNYRLHIGNYSGNAGDRLSIHSKQEFSTTDKDNEDAEYSCSALKEGGWWFRNCDPAVYLNGRLIQSSEASCKGIYWDKRNKCKSLKWTEMKFRSVG